MNMTKRHLKDDKRYWTSENVPLPESKGGRPRVWADLPFGEIKVGTVIGIPLSPEEVDAQVNAIRSHVWRRGKDLGKKYSVRVTDYCIGIWRVE